LKMEYYVYPSGQLLAIQLQPNGFLDPSTKNGDAPAGHRSHAGQQYSRENVV
jgi:hypothetical protein